MTASAAPFCSGVASRRSSVLRRKFEDSVEIAVALKSSLARGAES